MSSDADTAADYNDSDCGGDFIDGGSSPGAAAAPSVTSVNPASNGGYNMVAARAVSQAEAGRLVAKAKPLL